jgi:predicted ATPase/class 3 adenylate cyclase
LARRQRCVILQWPMRELPSGTVTFLFTDVEGSTRLLDALGAAGYAAALAEHRQVVRGAFAAHGGVEVDTQGDAFFVAFPTAPGALAAATAAAAALEGGPIRVRMGIHSGTPLLTDEGYVGVDVHRAARIAACGHGGQILLSAAARALVGDDGLLDLGEHRLKDLSAAERLYQVGDASFPPLRSLYRTNLPVPATHFLGRARELAEVTSLLLAGDGSPLVTLTGPGGVGKTRLALQAAGAAADRFADGVFWVPLATLTDPRLVLPELAQAIGARGELVDHISDQHVLVVLDNFEHLTGAAGDLAGLLAACPNLRVVVTSRELLRLPAEQAYPVPELSPEDGVGLFVARARAVQPAFELGAAVTELCARLEQLPLALELAAARVRVLTPEQLLERLSGRLDLLKAGRGVDPRQQTLRATIEWSHELLDADEKRLFARLAVFRGGWTLEAAEAVCDADLDVLQSLVDKSLVRALDESRLFMLETIRELATERLDESGDAGELSARHARFFSGLAAALAPGFESSDLDAFRRGDDELPNFRAAFTWLLEHDAAGALVLANSLRDLWFGRGYLHEARRWYADALGRHQCVDRDRAEALAAASVIASLQADWPETRRLAEESLRVEYESEGLVNASAVLTLGRALLAEGRPDEALERFRQAEELASASGNAREVAMARFNAGYLELDRGDYRRARTWLEAARDVFDASDHKYGAARARAALGAVALHDSRCDEALAPLRESLEIACSMGDRDNLAWALELCAVAMSEREPAVAARLFGAAEAVRETLGGTIEGAELVLHERGLASLDSLEPGVLSEAWQEGRSLTPAEAAALVLQGPVR